MRLVKFGVKNYRSISAAQNLRLGNMTVLVGPNNEGKSNILRAMIVGMRYLAQGEFRRRPRASSLRASLSDDSYVYARDYPIHLQEYETGDTRLSFEFELDLTEQRKFKDATGARLNTTLRIELDFGPDDVVFRVVKQKIGPQLTKKQKEVSDFIRRHLDLVHISAVRTADDAQKVVRTMVRQEMHRLHKTDEYEKALAALRSLEEPILRNLSDRVLRNLKEFLPEVADVDIRSGEAPHPQTQFAREHSIVVNDGDATLLHQKGDGFQSLATLALLKATAESGAGEIVLAIEEPEAHLHPTAIRRLRRTLEEISEQFQVILTTHNPILVSRNPRENIIVRANKAQPAKGLVAIRQALGVHSSDNLSSAEVVLLVEGNTDATIVAALLDDRSNVIRNAIRSGIFAVQSMDGVKNLRHWLSRHDLSVSSRHVFLDNDEPARGAAEAARDSNLLEDTDLHFATVLSKRESELEDLLDVSLYEATLQEHFQIGREQLAKSTTGKWTLRLTQALRAEGRPHDAKAVGQVKTVLAGLVEQQPHAALNPSLDQPISNLIKALEAKLKVASYS